MFHVLPVETKLFSSYTLHIYLLVTFNNLKVQAINSHLPRQTRNSYSVMTCSCQRSGESFKQVKNDQDCILQAKLLTYNISRWHFPFRLSMFLFNNLLQFLLIPVFHCVIFFIPHVTVHTAFFCLALQCKIM